MIQKDLGFVLKRFNFRETSIIVTLYTRHFGKITGILKGFYTPKKEFSSPLDIFSLNEFTFYPKNREIWLISYADLICDYYFLKENYAKAQTAGICFNLLEKIMQPWDVNAAVFSLVENTLKYLGHNNDRKLLYIFLIKFLTLSGFKPEFNRCIRCHGELEKSVFFSVSKGGLLCDKCLGIDHDAQKMSREVASSLHYIQREDFPLVCRLKPTLLCEEEMLAVLRDFLFYHLGFDISSYMAIRR